MSIDSTVAYIKLAYSLSFENGSWVARKHVGDAGVMGLACYRDVNKSLVIRKARANWGHFNFSWEMEAFNGIFCE